MYSDRRMRLIWFAKAAPQLDFIDYTNSDAKHAEIVQFSISEWHRIDGSMSASMECIPAGGCSCD